MATITAYVLIGCPHSEATKNTLENSKIHHDIIMVNHDEKDNYKQQNNMNTFPQVILNCSGEKIKIGGNSEFQELLKIIKETKNNKKLDLDSLKKEIQKKYNLDNKNTLLMIDCLKDIFM